MCAFRLGKEIAVNQWQQRCGLEARRRESLMGKADVPRVIAEGRWAWGQGLAEVMLIQAEKAEMLGMCNGALMGLILQLHLGTHLQEKCTKAACPPQGGTHTLVLCITNSAKPDAPPAVNWTNFSRAPRVHSLH